jgi:transporter family protein
MNYLVWTLLALVTYTFVPPLMGLTTARVGTPVATFVGAGMLSLTGLALALSNGDPIVQSVNANWLYVLVTSLVLTVAVFSFFNALSLGPVSIVTPIFGLFLVTSSVVGGLFLGESLSAQRIAAMGLAVLAVVLLSLE